MFQGKLPKPGKPKALVSVHMNSPKQVTISDWEWREGERSSQKAALDSGEAVNLELMGQAWNLHTRNLSK